jgi:hypothetical protein
MVETLSTTFIIIKDLCRFEHWFGIAIYNCWARRGSKVNCFVPHMAEYDCGFSVNGTEEIMSISCFWEEYS